MNRVNEFKGFSMMTDDDSDFVSLVSGNLSGRDGFDGGRDEFRAAGNEADARKSSELQSLLLMASLMLGGHGAAGRA